MGAQVFLRPFDSHQACVLVVGGGGHRGFVRARAPVATPLGLYHQAALNVSKIVCVRTPFVSISSCNSQAVVIIQTFNSPVHKINVSFQATEICIIFQNVTIEMFLFPLGNDPSIIMVVMINIINF